MLYKPGDLTSIPSSHVKRKKGSSSAKVFCDFHTCARTKVPTHTVHTETHTHNLSYWMRIQVLITRNEKQSEMQVAILSFLLFCF